MRVQLPESLCKELLQVARARGRTEQQIAPILREIIREWIDHDAEDAGRASRGHGGEQLDRIEELLREIHEQVLSRAQLPPRSDAPAQLDEAEQQVLTRLRKSADKRRITPPLSQREIADQIPGSYVTEKVVGRALRNLREAGFISITKRSGRGIATRYHVRTR